MHLPKNIQLNGFFPSLIDSKSENRKTVSKHVAKKGNLQHVVSVHEGKKPFKCQFCDKCFTTK